MPQNFLEVLNYEPSYHQSHAFISHFRSRNPNFLETSSCHSYILETQTSVALFCNDFLPFDCLFVFVVFLDILLHWIPRLYFQFYIIHFPFLTFYSAFKIISPTWYLTSTVKRLPMFLVFLVAVGCWLVGYYYCCCYDGISLCSLDCLEIM